MRHFETLEAACQVLREQEGCSIVGIEIVDGAHGVHEEGVFDGPTAFMLGNEGQVSVLTHCKSPPLARSLADRHAATS